MKFDAAAQDRVYAHCSNAIAAAGREKEPLFLARLVLLLFEQLADERACKEAVDAALAELPSPSLSAG